VDILKTLADRGAILTDRHFVYKSGKHGPHYINMDPVFPDTSLMNTICGELGLPFWPTHGEVDTVVGAATGAIPLAVMTALRGGNGAEWPYPNYAWADKDGDDFVFERAGFVEQLAGKRVLVVEDLLNTGDTVKKVIAQVRKHGGEVIGVSVICNRGEETAESLGVPHLEQLASVRFVALPADACYLCQDSAPIVEDIGHGKEYKQAHPDYNGGYIKLLSS
jgi:orotate phosphoribosyltransferase